MPDRTGETYAVRVGRARSTITVLSSTPDAAFAHGRIGSQGKGTWIHVVACTLSNGSVEVREIVEDSYTNCARSWGDDHILVADACDL